MSLRTIWIFITTIAFAMVSTSLVHAACSNPTANAGAIRYASNYNTIAFCNGTDWVSMAGWNNSSGGGASLLNELGDVDTTGASNGQALVYNSGNWIAGTAQDARIGTITDTKWCVGSGTSIVCNTNAPVLTEVDPKITALTNGKWCTTDGTSVICNTDAPLLTTAVLNDLADVDTTGQSTGKILAYNGTNWVVSDSTPASTALGDRITSGTTNVIATQDRSVTISTAGTPRVVIGENGNVGIGTATPSATVTVNGNAIISGTVQVAGAANEICTTGKLGTVRFNPVTGAPQICVQR